MTKEDYKRVAITITTQMGGAGRIKAMLGVPMFGVVEEGCGGVMFTFKGNRKMNAVDIRLMADDTYTMVFKRVIGKGIRVVSEHEGLYWDMLKPVFESETGLYLSL